MGANSHKAIYNPEFNPGGLDAVNIATTSRLFDNFESYADSTALQVVWSTTAVTRTLETTSPLRGAKSLKGAVTNATNQIKATINPAIFQYPFPKKLRYITFKTTVDSGTATFTFKLWGSADEANNYKEWTVTPKDKYNDIVIDLDPDNTESSPAPTATGASWEPTTINRISFEDLTNARTYYFDDIIFYYEYSLVDLIGLGTEPPISIGTDGSLQARLNSIHADVKGLEGQTSQYAKQGIAVAEMGQALQWALELNSDFAPPTTTEIAPGTYDIDKIRAAVTTNMVNDSAASESAGTIYASYTPSETDWNVGDLIKVTFSGGYVRTDEEPSVALTATTAALGTTVTVANAYAFEVGWLVKLLDNNTTAEWHTISSIDSPTTFTIDAAVGEFTVAQSATVNRVIQTDLSTAIFFTMLQAEAQSYKILATGTLTTSSATVPADTGRTEADNYWKGSWLMPITGAISNQPRLIAIFTNVGGVFTLDSEQPFTAVPGLVEYIIIGPNSQVVPSPDGTNNQTPAHVVGNKADVAVYAASATASVIAYLKGVLGAAVIGTGTLTTSSATVPAATGRTEADNYWRGSWLMTLTGAVAFQPRLITSFANVGGVFTLDAQHPFTAAPGTVAYILLSPNQSIVPSADATTNTTPAHVIGNKTDAVKPIVSATASDTAYLKALVARGMVIIRAKVTTGASPTAVSSTDLVGFGDDFFNNQFYMQVIQAGGAVPEPKIRKITDYTSTTGAFVVDTFTDNVDVNDDILIIHESLVAIGRNDADNVFDSSTVVFNVNGSLLERNEFLEKVLTNSTEYTSSAATTTTITAAALADVASQYIGQVVIPLEGAMAGEGRYIAAYNGTDTLTITPAWASDPDAGGAIKFVIFSTGLRIVPTALGTDGTTVSDSSTTVLGAIGADNNNNAFSSTNVAANSDGSVLERLEHILVALGGTTGTTTALGTTTTAIDTVRTEAADYWNGGVFICVDGTNKGLARPIYDFDAAADTLYFEPAFPNAVASGVNYLILTRFDVARILGDNNANNAYDSSSVVENRDGSVLERLEYLFGEIEDDSDSVENRIGNLTTRGNDGNIAAALGLDNLPDVASGDLYNILWKYLANTAISSPTTKAGLQYLQAVGSDDNNNDFDSSTVIANSNGSILERLEHILTALGGTTGLTTALGTTTTAIDTSRTEAADYWNGGILVCVDGTNKGLARPISDFDAGTDTLYFEPAFPNAVAAAVNYIILTRFDAARILGDNNADNAYASGSVVTNEDGSILERLEQIQEVVNKGTGTAIASNKSLVDALGSDGTTVTDSAVSVLGAIGANNANNAFDSSTVIGNKDGSTLERLESLLSLIASGKSETLPSFGEFWVDEAGIQAQFWTTAVGGTGAVTRQYAAPYVEVILNLLAGADTANLYSVQRWFAAPDTYGTNTVVRTLNIEFLAKFTSVANLDNASVFLGISTAQGATRASNNIIGFILAADILTSLTDDGAVETTNDASTGTTITNWVKYKIEVYSAGVKFYTNETLRTTHTTNLPDQSMYLNFYSVAEAAVTGSIELAQIRVWYSDEI